MFNIQRIIITQFVKEIKAAYQETYSLVEPQIGHILEWSGQLALENIANSDALYHNVEHTIMVTMVGQAILKGKHLREGGITPQDWLHFTLALLCHDIGYVKGVCRGDKLRENMFATGQGEELVFLPSTGTDAALTPYHVDRSKLFVQERFGS
ncbi:MAG: metal-dependent phosphohydrolase, partial [Candidatus Thermofonsia bacterium]